jgi:hypothetical protein
VSKKTALPADDALTPDREAAGDVAPAVPTRPSAKATPWLPLVRPPSVAVTPPGLMPAK